MIGNALRILRVFNDLTLVELAVALGIHASFISEVETGKRKPSLELIEKYAKYFKLRTSSILFFAEELDSKSLKGKAKDVIRRKMISLFKTIEKNGSSDVQAH
ncbi:MAG: helix-turn-helix transcriptional regulator [Pseudomonadota bacterium]|nr:helix-turn-helix transcriptional regulator [Pseudomonadota bacterium]